MILKTQKISKRYGKKIILQGIDAEINLQSISGMLGPNGAGKTTLFYVLAGLLQPSEGEILLNEKNQLEDKIALIKMSFKELDERDMVNSFKEFIKGDKKHETKE